MVRLNLFQSSLVHVILLCRCFECTNKKLPNFWTKEYMKGLSINFESLHFSSLILKGECSNCSLSLIVVINKAGRRLSIIIYTKTNNRIKLISSEKWSGYKQKGIYMDRRKINCTLKYRTNHLSVIKQKYLFICQN